ncbi:MAG TPA: dihydrolipoyl dehydrogenase [Beutenbergiaceae bacterium]|nr:dihydrolipoyl dehydrogenase [Beutenbergiaceae bacterium]
MKDEESAQYDVVILGGGSGGYATALRAAQLGQSVALVEADQLGGTCLHRGCIPTKSLLHSAHVADQVREAAQYGVLAELQGLDITAMHKHKDRVVSRMHKGLRSLLSARDITVIPGRGTVVGQNAVSVNDTLLRGRHLVLATGSRSRSLPGVHIGGRVITSDQALAMDWIPRSAIVVGGGVIGVEFASLWRSMGVDVTVLEALPRLIAGEDESMSTALERAFGKRGITVRTGVKTERIEDQERHAQVTLEDGSELTAEVVLMAVGRDPVTSPADTERAGVKLQDGFIQVDDRQRTTAESIYAVGDLVAGPQLAHRAFAHGIFVAEDIAGLEPRPVPAEAIPRITYSAPEVAAVGLTEQQARDRLGDDAVRTVEYSLTGNARTQIQGGRGMVKYVQQADGPIVGVHAIGPGVGELIGEAQLMVGWQAYPEDVAPLVHAHPTQNESLGEAALALAGKPLHSNH